MNLILYLIAGAIVGYVASRIMHTNSQQGTLLDIVVGVVGALLAGVFIVPLLGIGTINNAITIPTMLVTLAGSVLLFCFGLAGHLTVLNNADDDPALASGQTNRQG